MGRSERGLLCPSLGSSSSSVADRFILFRGIVTSRGSGSTVTYPNRKSGLGTRDQFGTPLGGPNLPPQHSESESFVLVCVDSSTRVRQRAFNNVTRLLFHYG